MNNNKSSQQLDHNTIQRAYTRLLEGSKTWQNEEEVRHRWISALEHATSLHLHAERRHEDSSYNNVIIEFKAPKSFKSSKQSAKFVEARDERLKRYIHKRCQSEGRDSESYIGIAIDGHSICFGTLKDGAMEMQHMLGLTVNSFTLVAKALKADFRRPLTSTALLEDFGLGSNNSQLYTQALADSLSHYLNQDEPNKVKMMFEEWRALYGQASALSKSQSKTLSDSVTINWAGDYTQRISAIIFILHTYNSFLVKLLAAEIVSAFGLTSTSEPAQYMASLTDDETLTKELQSQIEKSLIFRDAGIHGFVEEPIFSWYLEPMQDIDISAQIRSTLTEGIRGLLGTLSLYQVTKLDGTRDVLRDLYQGLVPAILRKSLGEYYTPDWLVDYTLNTIEEDDWLDKRALDPTCGSGAFLLAIIRRKRQELEFIGASPEASVRKVLDTVWGFDLNPLAVQISRVNYLMSIADLLSLAGHMKIEIPVLMADAIYSPSGNTNDPNEVIQYSIGSNIASLNIHLPALIAFDRSRLDGVLDVLGECVSNSCDWPVASQALLDSRNLDAKELETFDGPLASTYQQVLNLHRNRWNGIWFRIIRNYFHSAAAGKFDFIVGNPPWVRWSSLPELYRERVKPTCESYGIFSETKHHGGNELDVSAIITYAVADKWLDTDGRMSLVLTGSLFQNASSSGFRKFNLHPDRAGSVNIVPLSVSDFKEVKPFADASNHTVVASFIKSMAPVSYPVPYTTWSRKPGEKIGPNADLKLAIHHLQFKTMEATPVSTSIEGSPWAVLPRGRFAELSILAGETLWAAGRKGITTDLNGVYFLSVLEQSNGYLKVKSRPEAGRKDIGPPRTGWVENTLVYPLIKGASDFDSCYFRLDHSPYRESNQLYTVLPNDGISMSHYDEAEIRMSETALSSTRSWFGKYRDLMLDRSTYKRQMKGAPFWAVYNVGEYTFAPWKVIFPEMSSRIYAAVAGSALVPGGPSRPYIPDHKIYYVSFNDKASALFLCGLLNSSAVGEFISSHVVNIQMGNILRYLALPEYDSDNSLHNSLTELVQSAHTCHDRSARSRILAEIDLASTAILRV